MGVLLVLSASIVPVALVSAATTAPGDSGGQLHDRATDAAVGVQAEDESVTALEAMETAQNETNGTAVGVQREQVGEGGDAVAVYAVKVVKGNQTQDDRAQNEQIILTVRVNATNGSVLGTETETGEGGLFEGDEDAEDVAVSDTLNLSTLRSAVNATRIATNGSAQDNLTIHGVSLELRDLETGNASTTALVYVVDVENVNGGRANVIVSARKGREGVITVEPQQGDDGEG